MKILSVVGARPQFIKAAMVSKAIRPYCNEILLHTGQHYDVNMSAVFFDEMGSPQPDRHLGVGSGSHAEQTGQMMVGIEKICIEEKPQWVLVYGDTNSTLAGALAAAKLQIPVAHVEAGLRSFNRAMPEEINRVVCDHLSSLLFCPTQVSVQNLAREGVGAGVYLVGDVMYDALLGFLPLSTQRSQILKQLGLQQKSYALVTIHRAGNTDDAGRIGSILEALGQVKLPVVFPVHPRTRKVIEGLGLKMNSNIRPIDPVGYFDILQLEANADCILTDSGGIQKEAYWLGVRCITLRDETEWVETVETGWNRLVGTVRQEIVSAVQDWHPSGARPPVYGEGDAAGKISKLLVG